MLYVNNLQALNTILEQTRRDNGQYVVTFEDESAPSARNPRTRTRPTLGYRLRPVVNA